MNIDDRITYLNTTLASLDHAWPHILPELRARVDDLTLNLIGANDEQTRGRIKELRWLISLPDTLRSERDHIKVVLESQN